METNRETKKKKLQIDYNKKKFSTEEIEQIQTEVKFIMDKYPGHVPIICSSDKLKLQKNKYLVNKHLTFGEFVFSVRKKIDKLKESEGIYFLVNDVMIPMSVDIGTLYHQNKDHGNILRIWVVKENMFG